jgi:2-phosphosulfolactate phosphatase
MELSACPTAQALRAKDVLGIPVVAIDTLRAATTSAIALENGSSEIWPVASVEAAVTRRDRLQGALLGGERGMLPVAGFDAGNSPFDYPTERVAGRSLVLTTTNGTLALSRARAASGAAFAALRTAHLAANWLEQSGAARAMIALAGTGGHFSHEDALTAGAIVARLPGAEMDDLVRTCLAAFRASRDDLEHELANTPHGRRLIARGFSRDVSYAAQVYAGTVLPVRDEQKKGRLVAWRGA